MKKIFLLAALFGTLHCSLAQTAKTSKLRWGIKSGFNFSNTTNGLNSNLNVFKNPSIRGAVYLGAFTQLHLAEKLILQPELVYSPEGSLQEGQLGANNTYVLVTTLKLNYLNIPLMLQYNLTGGLYLEAGPQIGFLLKARNRFANPPSGPSSETDIKSNFSGTNFSLGAGLGYNFKNGFGISGRYVAGLSNIRTAAPEMKLNTIQIGTHYRFAK